MVQANPPAWPRLLTAGDRVVVASPAGPPTETEVDAGIDLLRDWGLSPDEYASTEEHWVFSATDDVRRTMLQAAFDDNDVAAVFCSRGGYGTQRIVDHLDVGAFVERRGVFVGFSDATALVSKLNESGLVAFYGPPLAWKARNGGLSRASLRSAIFSADPIDLLGAPEVTEAWLTPQRVIEGPLVGGNLTLLATSLGTRTELSVDGAIVLIEDDMETSRQIDRLLTQLIRSKLFEEAAGFALGQFTDPQDDEGRPMMDVIRERLSSLERPVVGGFAVGHGDNQLTVPFGARAVLDPGTARLKIDRT